MFYSENLMHDLFFTLPNVDEMRITQILQKVYKGNLNNYSA